LAVAIGIDAESRSGASERPIRSSEHRALETQSDKIGEHYYRVHTRVSPTRVIAGNQASCNYSPVLTAYERIVSFRWISWRLHVKACY
jgi:hypothetical protein